MQVYLVRHPQPNAMEGLCYGRLDVAVDPAQRALTLAKVRECIPAETLRSAPIFSSPLSRCAQFALQLALPRAPVIADELVEIDFGSWEGRPWNEVPREELDHWARDLWAYRPGGGENAQTLALRWQRWLDRIAVTGADAVIAVTHAGLIRVAMACAGKIPLDDKHPSKITFGSVHCIDSEHTRHGVDPRSRAEA
jgi:alpha-ribazole phosphatase